MNSLTKLSEARPADAAGSYFAAQRAATDAPPDGSAGSTPVLADDPVTLSQAGLDAHAAGLARFSQDAASTLMQRFASTLFGEGVATSALSFDAADIDVSSVLRAAGMSGDSGGAAGLSLTDSAHFLGKGRIVTADGQRFDFEIEIQYDAQIAAPAGAGLTPLQILTGRQLPEIDYPGTLDDLFKVLGRDVAAQVSGQDGDAAGGLFSLRLLRLVQTAALLAPRAQPARDNAKPDAYAVGMQPEPAAPLAAA